MKKKTLKQLKAEEKKARAHLDDIRDEISLTESTADLPIAKKKFEGKYFKYPSEETYMYCSKVFIEGRNIRYNGVTFYLDSLEHDYQDHRVRKDYLYPSDDLIEISKEKFSEAAKVIQDLLGIGL